MSLSPVDSLRRAKRGWYSVELYQAEAIQNLFYGTAGLRSPSSGAHSRDPLACALHDGLGRRQIQFSNSRCEFAFSRRDFA